MIRLLCNGRLGGNTTKPVVETASTALPRAIPLGIEGLSGRRTRGRSEYGTGYCVFNDDMQVNRRAGLGRRMPAV